MGMTSLVAQMVKCQPTMQEKSESESEVAQSCPTLCDPMDCSLSGSSVYGILQARILEWVAISYQTQVSHIAGKCFTI